MDFKTYLQESERTLSKKDVSMELSDFQQKLLHGAIGLATESGEVLDQMKRHIYYDLDLDKRNLKEELGDIMWYVAIFARELDLDIHEILDQNIEKLKKRFPDDFSSEKALHRDIDNELSHISKE